MSNYETEKAEREQVVRDEIRELKQMGFRAGWISDLKEGDLFAGPRMFAFDPPREIFFLERIRKIDGSYYEPEDDTLVHNVVVDMIVIDAEGLQRHLSYGSSHDIYIWQDPGA